MSGALGAVATIPADVLKTRMMTAPAGSTLSASQILIDILKAEGILGLFKGLFFILILFLIIFGEGAWARAIWVAPVGVMNFAGYELAKNAIQDSSTVRKQLISELILHKKHKSKSDHKNTRIIPNFQNIWVFNVFNFKLILR